jgi:prepilin-type N-terminal cleavage/methylation domain-containing protein
METHLIKNSRKDGFSMVELLFVVVVLGVTLTSILFLHTQIVKGRATIYQQTRATNYARQGIEMVRSIRDTNWRNGQSGFADMLVLDHNAYALEYRADAWSLVPVESGQGLPVFEYEAGSLNQNYERVLTLQPICVSSVNNKERVQENGTTCLATEELVGLYVASVVQAPQIEVKTVARLYNWR